MLRHRGQQDSMESRCRSVKPSRAALIRAAYNGFSSCITYQSKSTPKGVLFDWCGQQDSNLHAHAVEPKSTESTNSTMPAFFIVPCDFPCRGDLGSPAAWLFYHRLYKKVNFISAAPKSSQNHPGTHRPNPAATGR